MALHSRITALDAATFSHGLAARRAFCGPAATQQLLAAAAVRAPRRSALAAARAAANGQDPLMVRAIRGDKARASRNS